MDINTSTLSKKFKSPQWKARKRAKHEENVALRAQLHSQKAKRDMNARATIQLEIDNISKRG